MKSFIKKIFLFFLLIFSIFNSFNFNKAFASEKKKVYIDIGHGGYDSGAVADGYQEKDWNLDTGLSCYEELKKYGVDVYISRKDDKFVSLTDRFTDSNKKNSDYFISIHHNAGGGDRGEVIYSIKNQKSKELAENIQTDLIECGQSDVRIYNRTNSNGNDYYAVLRGSESPSVIVEVCFIDNEQDRKIANTKEKRIENGKIIAHSILKQLGIEANLKREEKITLDKKDKPSLINKSNELNYEKEEKISLRDRLFNHKSDSNNTLDMLDW